MKKIYALILATVMLFSLSVPVCANVISPSGSVVEEDAGDTSPKTGDMNLLYVGLAGTVFAATAVVAAKKVKKEA